MIRARLILPLLWLCAMQAEAQDVAQTWNNASGLNGWDPRAYAPPSVLRTRIDLAAQTVAKAEASGDVELQITALLDLSRAQEEKGDLENAVRSSMRAVGLAHGHSALTHRTAMLQLAEIHLAAEHPERTLEILSEIRSIPGHDRAEQTTFQRLEAQAKSRVLAPPAMIQYLNGVIGDVMKSGNKPLQAELLSLMASAQTAQGAFLRAIELEEQVMRIAVNQGNTVQAGISANNLAELLQRTPRTAEVPELYQRALILLDDVPVMKLNTMINAGVDRALRGDHPGGYALLREALVLSGQMDFDAGTILVERTVAALSLHEGELDRAFIQAKQALRTATAVKNETEQARTCELLASIAEQQGDMLGARTFQREAKDHTTRAEAKAEEARRAHAAELARWQRMERDQLEQMNRTKSHRSEMRQLALDAENQEKQLALVIAEKQLEESGRREESMGRQQAQQALALTKAALEGERKERVIKDLENTRLLQSMSMDRLAMEREQQARDMELLAQRNEVSEARSRTLEAERSRQRTMQKSSIAVAVLMLIFGGYMTYAWYLARKKKRTIWRQKKLIEGINEELAEKNHDIQSSLCYAQTIQSAILPTEEQFKAALPESFLLYKPLDKVSGDLPFMLQVGRSIYVAAIDCTGHGVPAGMMTFIAYYGLTDLIKQHPHETCGQILDRLHTHVKNTMDSRQTGGLYNDGMDIGLCKMNLDTGELNFSGAQLSLLIMHQGKTNRLKGDLLPLGDGQFERKHGYKDHHTMLDKGDRLFLFSDGMIHQFGGADGRKKFSLRRLNELLEANANLGIDELRSETERWFMEWKGETPQTDDLLMIGMAYAA